MPFSYIQGATVQLASGAVSSGDIQSGSITGMELSSGAVQSGHISSGAVQGFFGATRHIASGTVGVSDLGSGAVIAGTIGSGAVTSGIVASGQIASGHLASGFIANLGTLNSGSVQSGHIGNAAVVSGSIASGQVFTLHIASGGLLSGAFGSGQIASGHLASGLIANIGLSSGSVQSGHVASGAVQGFFGSTRHVASGTIGVFDFGSGAVTAGTVGSGAIVSGNVASGQIGTFHLASGTVTSGRIGNNAVASGNLGGNQIGNPHLASGAAIDAAQWLIDDNFTAAEPISGGRAVAFTQSGTLQIAMAAVSGRMPAVGVAPSNFASGATVTIFHRGRVFNTIFNFSGWMNQPVYVGASGHLVASGAPIASGNIQQIVGVSMQQSGLFVQVGDPLEGVIAQSGDVGSGAITGQAISGFYCVASGTLGTYDAASGFTAARSQATAPLFSGTSWNLLTAEAISGVRAVAVNQSGQLQVAMAAVSGRMPAVGIVIDNVLSGIQANVYTGGLLQFGSGLADYSGYTGKRAWIGRSGQVTTISGSFSSGGFASGDLGQVVGVITNSGAVLVNLDLTIRSGGPLGIGVEGIL